MKQVFSKCYWRGQAEATTETDMDETRDEAKGIIFILENSIVA